MRRVGVKDRATAACGMPYPVAQDASPGRTRRPADSGFTMIEMVVSLGLIAFVATFALSFHISALTITRSFVNRQVAAQLVSDILEDARADVLVVAWATPGPPVPDLADPDHPGQKDVNGVPFATEWQWELCVGSSDPCPTTTSIDELVRVVATVTWTEGTESVNQRGTALVSFAGVP